jgi:hypothetical protein
VSGCQVCGRNPSGRVTLGRNTGFLVMRQWHEFKGRLCRPHAIRASVTYLWKTLLFGWWGVISFFVNWGAVAIDLASLIRSLFIRRPEGEANLMDFSFGSGRLIGGSGLRLEWPSASRSVVNSTRWKPMTGRAIHLDWFKPVAHGPVTREELLVPCTPCPQNVFPRTSHGILTQRATDRIRDWT